MELRPFDPEQLLAHDGFVRGVARGLLRDEHAVDDVVQQTWIAALERGPAGLRSARAWLAAVARRFALRAHRADANRTARERVAARGRIAAGDEGVPSSDEILLREQARQEVVRAVLALDEPYRATLLLRYFESLAPREIAARQGVPVDTVQSRLQRGLAKVRARLDRTQRNWAWSLAAFTRPEPGAATATVAATAAANPHATASTAMLLSATTKAIAAAALVALLAVGAWWLTGANANESAGAGGATIESAAKQAVAEGGTADARETVVAKSPVVAPATAKSPALAASSPAVDTPSPPTDGWLASPDDPCGTLVVHVLCTEDESPVPGIGVHVLPYGSTDPVVFGQWKRTDATGTARFDRVPVGDSWTKLDRQFAQEERVIRGEAPQEITFRIQTGAVVEGRVVDGRGDPIEAAEVLMDETSGYPHEPLPVASTDAEGRFRVTHVWNLERLLGARARGFAPSRFRAIRLPSKNAADRTTRMDLVLESNGADVAGLIRDARGVPAKRALVLVGSESRTVPDRRGEGDVGPAPLRALTDDEGRFHVWGVAAGKIPIQARAHGTAPWSGSVNVGARESGWLEIPLSAEVLVEGTVRDHAGMPIEYASIQVGPIFHFASRWIRSDRNGWFRLPGLSSDDLDVSAWAQVSDPTSGKIVEIRTATRLKGAPGETVRWDPVLEPPEEKR